MNEYKDVVYIYHGILLSHKKWDIAICDNMDGTRGYCDKWNKMASINILSSKYNKRHKSLLQLRVKNIDYMEKHTISELEVWIQLKCQFPPNLSID